MSIILEGFLWFYTILAFHPTLQSVISLNSKNGKLAGWGQSVNHIYFFKVSIIVSKSCASR